MAITFSKIQSKEIKIANALNIAKALIAQSLDYAQDTFADGLLTVTQRATRTAPQRESGPKYITVTQSWPQDVANGISPLGAYVVFDAQTLRRV